MAGNLISGDLAPSVAAGNSQLESYSAEAIEKWLVEKLSNLLGVDSREIDVREPFASYGMGSTEAVSLSGELADWLGRKVPADLAYEYSTIETLARHLSGTTDESPSGLDDHREVDSAPIAIIGIGCRFPGSSGPQAFWQSIRDGIDAISEVPADRFNISEVYDPDPTIAGKINTRWGGFVEQVDQFDPQFFGISPREAARMDPQQRLLLEVTWEALEDAGQVPEKITGSQIGVFVGISNNDYGRTQFSDLSRIDAYAGTGNALSIAANRISYLFDFRGPSIAIDTACSSSLVAVHLACASLRNGESSLALAGGVVLPRFDLDEGEAIIIAKDQVNFAAFRAEIGREKFQSRPLQMFFGRVLAQLAASQVLRLSFAGKPGLQLFQQIHAIVLVPVLVLGFIPSITRTRTGRNSMSSKQFALGCFQRREAAPMNRARAVRGDGRQMLRRAVPFVPGKSVFRPLPVEFEHQPVARHLRQHARGGDGITPRVTLHNRRLRHGHGLDGPAVHERVLGCGLQLRERVVHGAMRRAQDVDGVNLPGANLRDGKLNFTAGGQIGEELFALGGGELLGIVQAFEFARQAGLRPFRRQNCRRGDDRPGQRPPARFVNACDPGQALGPQPALEFEAV